MFRILSDRLNNTLKKLRGHGRLSEKNIQKALKEVRNALLEADVALPVVKEFIAKVRRAALGNEVTKSLTPGQTLIKVVQRELTQVMGEKNESLNLAARPPAVILMAGLQGSGKTTSSAKLARLLKYRDKKKVMVVSTDVYRPAAINQLQTLAQELEIDWFASDESQKPVNIAKDALKAAKKSMMDVLIVDTAGRLHIDEDMMSEVKQIHRVIDPIETLFVVDSMAGQDAVNTAKVFHDALPLTGVILTKTDGDARGGAALSIRHVTGKPIKFMGAGEKTDALEAFHPDRVASRILGMGDVLSLIEEIEQNVDKEKSEQFAKKLKKGKGFDLQDFREQLTQMGKMGGLTGIVSKLPGMGDVPEQVKNQLNDTVTIRMAAMIDSMTIKERQNPDIIKGSRKRRIAAGSGVAVPDVNKLLKQFTQMQKMMKKVGRGGMGKMMRQMQDIMPHGGSGPIGM